MQRLDPDYNYIGIEFLNAFWEDVSACCIIPPDAAFRNTEQEWEDAEGNPIPPPAGEDGHRITILWRMDEPDDQAQQRPRLHAILAAFAHLYRRRVDRQDALRMVLVRCCEKSPNQSAVPPVNFLLWHNAFSFFTCSFLLEEVEGSVYERSLPAALPPCAAALHEAAALDWCRLVYGQLQFLLDTIVDATTYVALKATLDEWYNYSHQLAAYECERPGVYQAVEARIHRLPFEPWYSDVLRRVPGLNKSGLTLIPLESMGRFALLDYRPEEGRRFFYEHADRWVGRVRPVREGEEPMPYDAAKHLHLLPADADRRRILNAKSCPWYDEGWLGRDYNWC